jgi:hypothetical protein
MERQSTPMERPHEQYLRRSLNRLLRNPELCGELINGVVEVAGFALQSIAERYGTDAEHPGRMDGYLEFGVPTTYHGLEHTLHDIDNVGLYIQKCRQDKSKDFQEYPRDFTDEEVLMAVLATAWHDFHQGYGRGEDERRSAESLGEAMQGYNQQQPTGVFTDTQRHIAKATILATVWDPASKRQVNPPPKEAEKPALALMVADLMHIVLPHGPIVGMQYMAEAMALTEEAKKYGAVLRPHAGASLHVPPPSFQTYLQVIDMHDELRSIAARYLRDQIAFYATYPFADPRIDKWFRLREHGVAFWERVANAYDGTHLLNGEQRTEGQPLTSLAEFYAFAEEYREYWTKSGLIVYPDSFTIV